MIQEILDYSGIIMGAAGLLLMYKYAISPTYKGGSATYIYTEEELKSLKKEESKTEKHYKKMSAIGFVLSATAMIINLLVRFL